MNSFYENQAARFIEIDETDEGQLFCTIPSEKDMDVRYRLECVESATGVEVKSCSCPSRKPCKHIAILTSFWARIYKSNTAKAEQKAAEVVEVAPSEPHLPIAMELPAELQGNGKRCVVVNSKKDIRRNSSLYGAQQSAVLLMELPSRRAS